MKLSKLFTTALLSLALLSGSALAQVKEKIAYRTFKNAQGRAIQAVLVDKTDTKATLLLKNGKRATVDISSLSPDDQTFIKGWDKAKAYFLKECKSLSLGALLTLRGYEAIPIKFRNNSMLVSATINGKPAKFIIDTGAHSSLFHTGAAKRTNCKLGPFDEKVTGVSGTVPAAWAEVKELKIGETVFKDRQILSTDMLANMPKGAKADDDGLFGAEFLKELDAVISFKERKLFLRPDKSDESKVEGTGDKEKDKEAMSFRIFKTKSGKTYRGTIQKKTATMITLKLTNKKTTQVSIKQLIPEDATYAIKWTPEGALFLKHCRSLEVKELLELRNYQNFEYERKGNHIYVDGTLNKNAVTWMIDTGADNSLLDLTAAKENNVQIGPMDQKVYGIGGEAPAAGCMVESISMGNALFKKRKILATDMARGQGDMGFVGLFGSDFMRECNAVITYREQRIFLRQTK